MTVHILRHGRALCLHVPGIPEEWPPGERWVSFQVPNVVELATCDDCRQAFSLLPREVRSSPRTATPSER